jgi:membrane-associated phospholipid phosphatase
MLLNHAMKIWIHRPRPFAASPYVDMRGYSFPSGHTMAATLIYGLLAGFSLHLFKETRWRVLAFGAAATLVLAVGFSRVALGAHYLTDVLGAMAIGAIWLRICAHTVQAVRRAFKGSRVELAVAAEQAGLTDPS